LAPASTKPRAIISPMPRLPPVTSAVLPSMENKSEVTGAGSYAERMLLDGVNHVALVTDDLDRFHAFYSEVFGAVVEQTIPAGPGMTLSLVRIGPRTELNVFHVPEGPDRGVRRDEMFGRGPIDHLGLQAASIEAFDEIRSRLIARGCADEFVTDFGPILSVFFRDPDGLECEVCVENPDAVPGVINPPGTPATRYASS
jgi:catechol 2,3-dioxygenase-like lactoylglutathione lyase family enzyme